MKMWMHLRVYLDLAVILFPVLFERLAHMHPEWLRVDQVPAPCMWPSLSLPCSQFLPRRMGPCPSATIRGSTFCWLTVMACSDPFTGISCPCSGCVKLVFVICSGGTCSQFVHTCLYVDSLTTVSIAPVSISILIGATNSDVYTVERLSPSRRFSFKPIGNFLKTKNNI